MAASTSARTQSVGSTKPQDLGGFLTQVFSDPNVQNDVGTGIGSLVNAGLGAFGIGDGGKKPPPQEEKKDDTMLIVGGAVAVVAVIVIVMLMRRK
jgi:hypothetical protein